MKDLRRVGVEREERESFQVSIICRATFLLPPPSPPTEADGGLRRVGLPGCRPLLALLSFISGYTLTHAANQLHNGCCIDFSFQTMLLTMNMFFFLISVKLLPPNPLQKDIMWLSMQRYSEFSHIPLMLFRGANYHILLMHLNTK